MYPILFKIGPVTIYTYGVCVFFGLLCAYFLCTRQAVKQGFDKNIFSDLLFWSVIFSFIGARVSYVFLNIPHFIKYPIEILLSRSGFVFYGGLFFGIIVFYYLTKRYKLSFFLCGDIIALGIPLAHAFGRVGCFCYGCCYGKHTDSWIGIEFPAGSPAGLMGGEVIPTQLIAVVFLILIFFVLFLLTKKKRYDGQIMFYYMVLYGIFRFSIEFFRGDPRGSFFSLSTSQWFALLFIATGILFFVRKKFTIKRFKSIV